MNSHNQKIRNTTIDFFAVLCAMILFFGLIWPSIDEAFEQRENFQRARTNAILQQGDIK